jgi:methyl-accepting chemotaxis protein
VSFGIRAKLFGGYSLVLALVLVIGFIGLHNTTSFAAQFESLYNDDLVGVVHLTSVQQSLYELRIGAAGAAYAAATPDKQAEIKATDAKWLEQLDQNMAAFESTSLTPEQKAAVTNWRATYPEFLKTRQQVLDLVERKDLSAAADLRNGQLTEQTAKCVAVVNNLYAAANRVGDQMNQDTTRFAELSGRVMLLAMLLALAAGLSFAFFMSRGIAGGVKEVQRVLTSIAENDATSVENGLAAMSNSDLSVEARSSSHPIEKYGRDEIGQTARVANTLLVKLQSTIASYETARAGLGALVGQVRAAADGLADSSVQLDLSAGQAGAAVHQVTQAIQNVAAGVQGTSSDIQETNTSVTQLAESIDGIARGASEQARQVQSAHDTAARMASGVDVVAVTAEQVASASDQTRKAAEHGGVAVRETTAAMAEIQAVVGQAADRIEELGRLGERIGAVVETIDDIAEQTNLLALNAAIEAARAGEHGRGFAVVADEVRKLAERSSRETKQIADLIQQVQAGTHEAVTAMQAGAEKVGHGSEKADLAGQALDAILSAVEHTVRQATEITSASREMADGARRMTEVMSSISAIVEENTASTEEMTGQSARVADAIRSIAAVTEEQSASTEEVSASAEEMSAQIAEMNAQAQELSATAEQLRKLVARFRVSGPVVAHSPAPSALVQLRRAA